jgi:formylmethanofuran dehydrogenase subunit B
MTDTLIAPAPATHAAAVEQHASALLTCPACGLACDDLLRRKDGTVDAKGCPIGETYFARDGGDAPHLIGQQSVSYVEAVEAAAKLLARAERPWFGGLGADIDGLRATIALADRTQGVTEHHTAPGLLNNMNILQSEGWMVTTFSEVANHADTIVIVGDDPTARFPRLLERLALNRNAMYRTKPPKVVLIGPKQTNTLHPAITEHIVVPNDQLAGQIGALSALVEDHHWRSPVTPAKGLAEVATLLAESKYVVISWDVGMLPGQHPDLTVEILAHLVRRLNLKTRASGLPLGGTDNGIGSVQVHAWTTGFPARVRFAASGPDFDPYLYSGARAAKAREIDLAIWVAAIGAQPMPELSCPVIALAPGDVTIAKPPAVTIRVGQPGIDHGGNIVRMDGVVSVPVAAARPSVRPSVAEAMQAILVRLPSQVGGAE